MVVILKVHLLATVFMVGLIWFIQIVHYPMFADVGPDAFVRYERIHQQRTTWVVMPVMLVELATAILLVVDSTKTVTPSIAWIGAFLLAVAWATTFFVSVPCHTQLAGGMDDAVLNRLVFSNWIRTAAWTIRGVGAVWILKLA